MELFKLGGVFLILVMLVCTMSGCMTKQELGDLTQILGAAFDCTEDGEFLLTVELAHQETSNSPAESMLFSGRGKTLAELSAGLEQSVDKHLYWGNMVVTVFGDTLSKQQILDIALYLYQDERLGPSILLMQAEGSAAAVLGGKFGEANYVSMGLEQAMDREFKLYDMPLPTAAAYLESILTAKTLLSLPLVTVDAAGEVHLEDTAHV